MAYVVFGATPFSLLAIAQELAELCELPRSCISAEAAPILSTPPALSSIPKFPFCPSPALPRSFPFCVLTISADPSQHVTTATSRSRQDMPARPFLRTASKCQLIPSSGYENPPPVAEVKGSPQHVVIGFHLISEQIKQQADACDSPRSVLEPSVLCASSHHEQSRSPRSPRSVLGCLISGQESHRPVREGVGLGVVAAIKAEEARMPKPSQDLLMKSKPIAISVQNEYTGMRNRNVCEGGFVANAQAFYSEVTGVDDFDNFDVDDDPMTGVQESIFCAASPFSACCSLEYPTRDFLSVCFLCKCHLSHGKDVYMYKGDKAFCSAECRYQQIVIDEFKERQMAAANCYMGTSTQHSKAFAGASAAVA